MTINELRTKRAKLWEGTKAFLESHRNENGVLSVEDDASYPNTNFVVMSNISKHNIK